MIVEVTQVGGPVEIPENEFPEWVPDAYFLAASVGDVHVGQVCRRLEWNRWHMDKLFVHQNYRNSGVGQLLIECCCHDALRHTDAIHAIARRNGRLTPEHYQRYTRSLGGNVEELEAEAVVINSGFIDSVRDLRPLRARISSGAVVPIYFPYRREVADHRSTAPQGVVTPLVAFQI